MTAPCWPAADALTCLMHGAQKVCPHGKSMTWHAQPMSDQPRVCIGACALPARALRVGDIEEAGRKGAATAGADG